ncbi:MAG: hypothetical protein U0X75_08050 [Acidobacteriota bacterium]
MTTLFLANLRFDGFSYNLLGRVLALSNIPDRASGNNTLLILNRIGGNLGIGAGALGPIFGLLYNDVESSHSFSFTPNTCQLVNSLSTLPAHHTALKRSFRLAQRLDETLVV